MNLNGCIQGAHPNYREVFKMDKFNPDPFYSQFSNHQESFAGGDLVQSPDAKLKMQLQQSILLREVTNEIRQTLDTKTILQIAVDKIQSVLKADRVAILQLDPKSDYTEGVFIAEKVVPIYYSVVAAHIHHEFLGQEYDSKYQLGHILSISDIYYTGLSECDIQIYERFQIRATLDVPILHEDKLWGLLCIHQCSEPRVWLSSEIEFVQHLAPQLCIALKKAELYERALEESQQLQMTLQQVLLQKEQEAWKAKYEHNISEIIQRIRQSLDIEDIFLATTHDVRESLGCDRVVIYEFFPDWSGEVLVEATAPHLTSLSESDLPTAWQDAYLQKTQGGKYRNNETTAVADIYKQNYAGCYLENLEKFQIRAYMIVPVFIGETLWGLLAAYQLNHPRQWYTVEQYLLKQAGAQLGMALQQAELLYRLKISKNKAEAANQAKSSFLAHMSHELRTPLNAILGFSQLLARDKNLTSEQKHTLSAISRSGSHLLNLINDVLEVSKIEAGKVSLHPENCNLLQLLDSLQEMFALKAKYKRLDLNINKSSKLPLFIRVDESRLRQVLINLLTNALKFTEFGSVTLRVNTQPIPLPEESDTHSVSDPSQPSLSLCFEVEDTGVGIDENELANLFDAFTQTSSGYQSQERTGLGLAICRHFVNLMQGDIQIKSRREQGTTVFFQIPVLIPKTNMVEELSSPQVIGLASDQSSIRMLIVEDNLDNLQILNRLMTDVGFEVQTVENGEAAVNCWKVWHPHIIWMDWFMPVMNGYEATKAIRSLESQRRYHMADVVSQSECSGNPSAGSKIDVPDSRTIIIAITASVFEDIQAECKEAGCDDFLSKPYQQTMLFDLLAKHLKLKFLYGDQGDAITSPDAHDPQLMSDQDTKFKLSQLSVEWLAQLQQAAIELDEEVVTQKLADIATDYPDLTTKLLKLFRAFQFDQIAEFAGKVLTLKERDE